MPMYSNFCTLLSFNDKKIEQKCIMYWCICDMPMIEYVYRVNEDEKLFLNILDYENDCDYHVLARRATKKFLIRFYYKTSLK